MKAFATTSLLLLVFVATVVAGNPHRRRQPPLNQPNGPQLPSVLLSQFIANQLDGILSPIDRQIQLPRTRLSHLRAQFTDKLSQAPDAEKAQYQTAVAVCDALNAAMDEREQTIASIQSSAAVHGPSDLGARRKDIPSHGRRADARLAKIEEHQERHEEANRKEEAAQKDDFLTQQHKNNWTQRALQIRQQIQILTERQSQAERAGHQQPAAAANAAPATNTITLDKAIQVKVKYGTATIQPGTTLPVVSRDANGVVVQYMGENVFCRRNRSKRDLTRRSSRRLAGAISFFL